MEKVMLSKLEVEALKSTLEMNDGDRGSVVHWHSHNLWDGKRAPLNELDLETICTALFVGYEIKPEPEEEVLKLYESYPQGGFTRDAVLNVLNVLNIQIQGINC